jgi:hypothetical protein
VACENDKGNGKAVPGASIAIVELGFAVRSSVAYNRGFIRGRFCDASDSNSCDDKVALFILCHRSC